MTQKEYSLASLVLTSVGVFLVSVVFLFAIDFVPEQAPQASSSNKEIHVVAPASVTPQQTVQQSNNAPLRQETSDPSVLGSEKTREVPERSVIRSTIPNRITIDTIGVDTPVLTPSSVDVAVLDRALLAGAVHYPESAYAGELGNMLVFGHSSYLPVVHNKAFQAFNELGKLKPGATVQVYTDTDVFEYVVQEVRLARADEVVIEFGADAPMLTLATCNTFGAKQERWVAKALQTSVRAL